MTLQARLAKLRIPEGHKIEGGGFRFRNDKIDQG
jgi:hypothetical protein